MRERTLDGRIYESATAFSVQCGNPAKCRAYIKTEPYVVHGRIVGHDRLPGVFCDCAAPEVASNVLADRLNLGSSRALRSGGVLPCVETRKP